MGCAETVPGRDGHIVNLRTTKWVFISEQHSMASSEEHLLRRGGELDTKRLGSFDAPLEGVRAVLVDRLSVLESPERALNRPLEFVSRSTQGELDRRGLMGHGNGLVTGQSGFQHAPDVVSLRFVAVGIAEMGLDPCNPITKSADRSLDTGLNKGDDLFTSVDIIVRVDLNLHPTTSFT
jgi:hypothetical protein